MVRKRTPEEIAKAKQEGQAFIQAREKEASKLAPGQSGVPTRGQMEQASQTVTTRELQQQQLMQQQEQEAQRLEAGKAVLDQTGFFDNNRGVQEDVTSLKTPLSESRENLLGIPIAGASAVGLAGAGEALNRPGSGAITKRSPLSETLGTPIQDPETLREMAFQKIQEDVINKGITNGEAFGAMVEAIPVIGGLASKYAGGLIESPSANARTVFDTITSTKEFAITIAEKAAAGKLGNPIAINAQIIQSQETVAELEAKLKLLISVSPILQADPDYVNRMEREILRTKNALIIAEEATAAGLTGVGASDASLYLELEKLKEESNSQELPAEQNE